MAGARTISGSNRAESGRFVTRFTDGQLLETCNLQKILGWIPARANSKGVPGKNKRILGSQPLIVHAIRTAQLAACLDRIVGSTDDPDIASLAEDAHAEIPWMRPSELAMDHSPVTDAAVYDIERLRAEQD